MNDTIRTTARQAGARRAAPVSGTGQPDQAGQQVRHDQGTRERLLAAAARVFAERGYKSATVRDICRRASANVAAVNYHFGGKDNLYAAMLDHYMRACQAAFPLDAGVTPESPPEARLHAFVHGLVQRILGGGNDPVSEAHGKLVSLEFIDPTPACDLLLREHIAPVNDLLVDILRGLLGPAADDPDVLCTCLLAIVGHISYHYNGRAAIAHFCGHEELTPEALRRIADGVTRFTLGGIMAMADASGSAAAPDNPAATPSAGPRPACVRPTPTRSGANATAQG